MAVSAAELAILISAKDRASGTIDKVGGKLGKFAGVAKVAKLALLGIGVGALAAAAGLFKIGADFDKAFDTIRVGTGATGEALKALQGDFKAVFKSIPTDMTSAADAVTQFNTLTGATGPALQRMAKNGLEAARLLGEDSAALIGAAGKAFNVFELGADRSASVLDEVFTASQKSNVPMTKLLSTLQTYGPVLKNLGFGVSESIAFFASLEKAGIDVSRVMPGLNAFMRKLADEGVTDLSAALDDQIQKIKGAKTESEALNLATQAFGAEGAQRLSVAIRTGALDLEEFTAELKANEGAILDTAKETESLSEKFTRFKNTVLVAIQPLATGFFDALSDVAALIEEKVIPKVQLFIDLFKGGFGGEGVTSAGLHGRIEAFGILVKEVFVAAEELFEDFKIVAADTADILNKHLVPVLETLGEILLKDVLPAIQKVFNFLRNNKEILAAVGIAIITVLVPGIIAWTVATIANAAAHIALAVATLLAYAPILLLIAAISLLAFGIIKLIQNWDEIVAFITGTVVPLFTNLWATIDEFLGNLPLIGVAWELVKKLIKAKIDAVIGIVQGVIDIGKNVISFFKNVFKGDWDAAWTDLKEIAIGALNLFLDFLRLTLLGDLLVFFKELGPKILTALGDLAGLLLQKGKDLLIGFAKGYVAQWSKVVVWLSGRPKAIANAIGNLASTLWFKGWELISGLWNGIKERAVKLFEDLKQLADDIIGAITDPLGILSPSKVMQDVGVNLMKGLQLGLASQAFKVNATVGNIAGAIPGGITGGGPGAARALTAGRPVQVVIEIHSFFPPDEVQLQAGVRRIMPELRAQLRNAS